MAASMLCPRCWGEGAYPRGTTTACGWCHGSSRVDDVQLSPNFSLGEMLRSQTAIRRGIDNAPPPEVVANLRALCTELLQPLRDAVGPLQVTSGYRCRDLNVAIGAAKSSAHQEGSAADVVPLAVSIRDALERARDLGVPFDQLIYEGTWLHVGRRKAGIAEPRGQVLMMFSGRYLAYDPGDPRVV